MVSLTEVTKAVQQRWPEAHVSKHNNVTLHIRVGGFKIILSRTPAWRAVVRYQTQAGMEPGRVAVPVRVSAFATADTFTEALDTALCALMVNLTAAVDEAGEAVIKLLGGR